MASWSGMRHKLEREYLAESLRGRIQYYTTTYRKSPDHEGRAAIRFDKKEIMKGCYWNNWCKAHLFPRDDRYVLRMETEFAYMDDTAIQLGVFDQRCFYHAFYEFDNQSIDRSLSSEDMLVRIFAILDRRVGKRRLRAMKADIEKECETIRCFYAIRAAAENVI